MSDSHKYNPFIRLEKLSILARRYFGTLAHHFDYKLNVNAGETARRRDPSVHTALACPGNMISRQAGFEIHKLTYTALSIRFPENQKLQAGY